jgi:KaiC/GvpD/RAD55 family RecA-like ATPase/5S rRNA maturation endonuclease (ribonuclease M5)
MKENPDILAYIKKKGWKYDDKRDQKNYYIESCPNCGDNKFHFHINRVTGVYNCWKCPEETSAGNMWKLKKSLGDIVKIETLDSATPKKSKSEVQDLRARIKVYHKRLLASPRGKKIILEKYGFGEEEIKRFRLGLKVAKDKTGWLVLPYFNGETLTNVKYRTLPPAEKTFRREKDMESSLYQSGNFDTDYDYCVLVEGETDTISGRRLGIPNVFGNTVGARGFKAEWKDFLEQFERVYLVYDPDVPGQEGAKKMAKRIGLNRCYNIKLPVSEDATDNDLKEMDLTWFVKKGLLNNQKFLKLMENADQFDIEDVQPLGKVLRNLQYQLLREPTLETKGLRTQYERLNKLMGDFQPGDLIVLSGTAKTGKTTFGLNWLNYWAMELGIPSLMYCLEMMPERMAQKQVSLLRLVEREHITYEDLVYIEMKHSKAPFYYAHSFQFDLETVLETIREAHHRYGIEVALFDHLHFLIRDSENVAAKVGVAVRAFKMLAEELAIPIILVCQPKKIQGKNVRPTRDDLRDSSSIGQDADTVVILHRDRLPQGDDQEDGEPLFSDIAECIVDATRYNPGGMTKLYYNGALSRFWNDKKEEKKAFKQLT